MFDKMLSVIKDKDIIIPRLLLTKYKDLGLNDQDFIVLTYLLNIENNVYDPKAISSALKIELIEILTIISDLTEKGIIKIDMMQKGNKKVEMLNIDPLYEKLTFSIVNEEKKEDTSIYDIFEKEFARTLSPIECNIISGWKEASYADELIKEALKEAVYNGAFNLKYIDKVLDEWHKKNIKTKEDVELNRKKFKENKNKAVKKEVFSYDWLNDEE